MTISRTTNRWGPYAGNGVTTDFQYDNKIFADGDLKVYLEAAADGTLTPQALGSDYTVSGAGVPTGGNVSFIVPPPAGYRVIIVREVPATQDTDFQDDGPFPAEASEDAHDKNTVLAQQVLDQIERSLRQPDNDGSSIGRLPRAAERAGMYLAFNADGEPIASPAPEGGNPVSAFMAIMLGAPDAAAVRSLLGVDRLPVMIQAACSDETTGIAAGAGKVAFRAPHAFTLTAVRASLSTAQSSGSTFTVDINVAGSSVLSTKLTIDNGAKTSVGAAAPAEISDPAVPDDAEITVDVDQIGDGTAKGLKVTLIGYRPVA